MPVHSPVTEAEIGTVPAATEADQDAALAAAARSIKLHTTAPRYPTGTNLREVAQLSNAMQSMTESLLTRERELELLNQTLEQQVLQRTEALAAANKLLEHLATIDPLTGTNNRRRFDEKLEDCARMGKRTGRGFSILLNMICYARARAKVAENSDILRFPVSA